MQKTKRQTLLRRFFSSKKERIPAYYKDYSEMPTQKWVNLNHYGSAYKYMFVDSENIIVKEWHLHYLHKAVENIREQISNLTGISKEFRDRIDTEKRIALLEWAHAATGDESNLIFAQFEKSKLSSNESDQINYEKIIAKQKIAIEKDMGIRLIMSDISVKEFYEYIVILSEKVKK